MFECKNDVINLDLTENIELTRVINNMNDYTPTNIKKVLRLIRNGKIKTLEDFDKAVKLNSFIIDGDNNEIKILNINSDEHKQKKRKYEKEISEQLIKDLPEECRPKKNEINNEDDMNKLINVINKKIGLINKIL